MAMYTFNNLERFKLYDLIPTHGDITTVRIIQKLREELAFSEEEVTKFNIRTDGGRTLWDSSEDKAMEIGPKGLLMLRTRLEAMDVDKEFTLEHVSLIEKLHPDLLKGDAE